MFKELFLLIKNEVFSRYIWDAVELKTFCSWKKIEAEIHSADFTRLSSKN